MGAPPRNSPEFEQLIYRGAPAVMLIASIVCFTCLTACSMMPASEGTHVTIAVDKLGNYYWNGEPVSCAELELRIAGLTHTRPKKDVCQP